MTRSDAEKLARWVNTHDDGTPGTRARIIEVKNHPGIFGIIIRSTQIHSYAFGDVVIENVIEEYACNYGQARRILGY